MLMVYLQGTIELCKTREHPKDPSKKNCKGTNSFERKLKRIKGKTTKECSVYKDFS